MPNNSDIILERMMALHPKVIDLTLDRMWRLLGQLGDPQNDMPPVVHIAGTNGKGSTQAMMRAGLEGAGKTVHAYTSPHLARFHERIRLAGALISEPLLTDYLDECYRANRDDNITYFEITTCAALLAFAKSAADYTLLEVGLGGRLDATNVIDKPEICIIAPIDYDHQQFLGTTLAEIAGEKAGILKRGVPAIVNQQHDEALEVIERRAERIGAPLHIYGQHWHVASENGRLIFQDEMGLLDLPLPNLAGPHQIQNAGAALAALRQMGMSDASHTAAMTRAEWPARMQRINTTEWNKRFAQAEIWLDGGHNPAAGTAISATLQGLAGRPTHIICGMINTKDISGFLKPIAPHAASLTAVTIPDEPNAVPAGDICAAAQGVGIGNVQTAQRVEEGLENILTQNPDSRILISGSLYLAGYILREIV